VDSNHRGLYTLGFAVRAHLAWAPSGAWYGAGIVPADRGNTPGWIRTSDPGIRNLRRDDFAVPEETTKSTLSFCPSTTSASISGFVTAVSFIAHGLDKGTDLRNPQIR